MDCAIYDMNWGLRWFKSLDKQTKEEKFKKKRHNVTLSDSGSNSGLQSLEVWFVLESIQYTCIVCVPIYKPVVQLVVS